MKVKNNMVSFWGFQTIVFKNYFKLNGVNEMSLSVKKKISEYDDKTDKFVNYRLTPENSSNI